MKRSHEFGPNSSNKRFPINHFRGQHQSLFYPNESSLPPPPPPAAQSAAQYGPSGRFSGAGGNGGNGSSSSSTGYNYPSSYTSGHDPSSSSPYASSYGYNNPPSQLSSSAASLNHAKYSQQLYQAASSLSSSYRPPSPQQQQKQHHHQPPPPPPPPTSSRPPPTPPQRRMSIGVGAYSTLAANYLKTSTAAALSMMSKNATPAPPLPPLPPPSASVPPPPPKTDPATSVVGQPMYQYQQPYQKMPSNIAKSDPTASASSPMSFARAFPNGPADYIRNTPPPSVRPLSFLHQQQPSSSSSSSSASSLSSAPSMPPAMNQQRLPYQHAHLASATANRRPSTTGWPVNQFRQQQQHGGPNPFQQRINRTELANRTSPFRNDDRDASTSSSSPMSVSSAASSSRSASSAAAPAESKPLGSSSPLPSTSGKNKRQNRKRNANTPSVAASVVDAADTPPADASLDGGNGAADGDDDASAVAAAADGDRKPKRQRNEAAASAKKVKHKPMSTHYATKDWNEADARRAMLFEREINATHRTPRLMLRFPDPEISKDSVKAYSSFIDRVHFQQPSAPRYCFVTLKPNADVQAIRAALCEIPFGTGKITAELKNHHREPNDLEAKDIDPYTIYLGNLPKAVCVRRVKELFPGSTRTDIGHAQKMKNTRYAFVRFDNVDAAIAAFRNAIEMNFGSRSLVIRFRRTRGTVESSNAADGSMLSDALDVSFDADPESPTVAKILGLDENDPSMSPKSEPPTESTMSPLDGDSNAELEATIDDGALATTSGADVGAVLETVPTAGEPVDRTIPTSGEPMRSSTPVNIVAPVAKPTQSASMSAPAARKADDLDMHLRRPSIYIKDEPMSDGYDEQSNGSSVAIVEDVAAAAAAVAVEAVAAVSVTSTESTLMAAPAASAVAAIPLTETPIKTEDCRSDDDDFFKDAEHESENFAVNANNDSDDDDFFGGNTATDNEDFAMDTDQHNDGYNINLNEFLSEGGRDGRDIEPQSVTAFGWRTSSELRPIKEEFRPGGLAPAAVIGIKVETKPVVVSMGQVAERKANVRIVDEEEEALFDDLNPD